MKPTLYQYQACPFCAKVKAILDYKKVDYNIVEVNPMNKKEIKFSTNYQKVPIFIDAKGNQINDSTHIMREIDKQYGAPAVFETDSNRQSSENQWLEWSDQVFVRALPPLIYRTLRDSLSAFSYITQVSSFPWWQKLYIMLGGALVMRIVAKKSAAKQGIKDPEAHFESTLQNLSQALQHQKFLGGNAPNGADFAIFGIMKSVQPYPVFKMIEKNKNVFDWYKSISNA